MGIEYVALMIPILGIVLGVAVAIIAIVASHREAQNGEMKALLAAGDLLGIAPEQAANPLSLALTIVLWALVARFAPRLGGDEASCWPALVAPLLLAATRSVAVWSTSGLETRLLELQDGLDPLERAVREITELAGTAIAGSRTGDEWAGKQAKGDVII